MQSCPGHITAHLLTLHLNCLVVNLFQFLLVETVAEAAREGKLIVSRSLAEVVAAQAALLEAGRGERQQLLVDP